MKDTYLVSMRHICVSRDLPDPHGSMRKREARTTALTPPSRGASLCSTDVETRIHAPFGNCVRYDLKLPRHAHFRADLITTVL